MNLWDMVTGADMDRQMKAFQKRVQALPADYQTAWQTIVATFMGANGNYTQTVSSFTGRNLMPIMDGIVALMEETHADGLSAEAALGKDVAAFATQAAQASGESVLQDRWRAKLNADVHRKLGR